MTNSKNWLTIDFPKRDCACIIPNCANKKRNGRCMRDLITFAYDSDSGTDYHRCHDYVARNKRPPTISDAYKWAKQQHADQLDDDGQPYHLHLWRVYQILSIATSDSTILKAAILHDILEDTDCTASQLRKLWGSRVANLVLEVTHEGQKDNHGYCFPRLHSREAVLIKFADRLDNLSRMGNWPTDRQEQYLRKSVFWRSE